MRTDQVAFAESSEAGVEESEQGSRGDRRRARILSAFHDCIIRNGYAKTTLRDVAKAAGISASHLLYYFPGKDSILEHYFEDVAMKIVRRIDSFRNEDPLLQINLLSDLFFAGKCITRSEIGFMLECFGVAVHDKTLRKYKKKLDRYCKAYLADLFGRFAAEGSKAEAHAEIAYAMLIGLRTAAYFDKRVDLTMARQLFHQETLNLAGIGERNQGLGAAGHGSDAN
jgi:AcrR family transcriptional regulator